MTLPSSGPISLNNINIELGIVSGTQISLNDSRVRALLQAASGQISLSSAYGKSNAASLRISNNQTNLNLYNWAISQGWNGSSAITVTIDPGIYIYSTNPTIAALTVNGFINGITIVNKGFILGRGGTGGTGGYAGDSTTIGGTAGGNGGNALNTNMNLTIDNINGYIAGGGGGGGGAFWWGRTSNCGGSGGGGAAFGVGGPQVGPSYFGSIGYAGGTATYNTPGNGGSGSSGSAGGAYYNGGAGGGWGTAGVVGGSGNGKAGGQPGKAVNLNGYSVTWVGGDTSKVYGAVS